LVKYKYMFEWVKKKTKLLSWLDMKFLGLIGVLLGLCLAIWFPKLTNVNFWWFLAPAILLYFKLFYVMFLKKNSK